MKSTRCWIVAWDCDTRKYRPSWYKRIEAQRERLTIYATYELFLRAAEFRNRSSINQ